MITNYKIYENNLNLNTIIDFTIIKDYYTIDNIKEYCNLAKEKKYYSVCTIPKHLSTVKSFLNDSNIKTVCMLGIPNGKQKIKIKLNQIRDNILNFDELDFIINYKILKDLSLEDDDEKKQNILNDLKNEIIKSVRLCHKDGKIFKAIIEIDELTYDEINTICNICSQCSVDYIQTSSGFSKNKLSLNDKIEKVKYIRKILPDYINIKISGGIRTPEQINEVRKYADRIGTSVKIF